MPANHGNTPVHWSPKPDFAKDLGLCHIQPNVTNVEQLADWLDDAQVVPAAEAYRFLRPALAREIILDQAALIAPGILADTYNGRYAVDEAYDRHLALGRAAVD